MNHEIEQFALPLLTAELPVHVAFLLRDCGIPIRHIGEADHGSARGKRQFVLFDSTIRQSRRSAENAAKWGMVRIDLSAFSSWRTPSVSARARKNPHLNPARCELIWQLKDCLEAQGCPWVRVADYPFPFQSALIEDADLRTPLEFPTVSGHDQASVSQAYLAGLPIVVALNELRVAEACDSKPNGPTPNICRDLFPLLWQTTADEYQQWTNTRRQVSLYAARAGNTYTIHTHTDNDGLRPAVEVWRGNHFVSLPLRSEVMKFNETDVAFRVAGFRNPGGVSVMNEDGSLRRKTSSSRQRKSA